MSELRPATSVLGSESVVVRRLHCTLGPRCRMSANHEGAGRSDVGGKLPYYRAMLDGVGRVFDAVGAVLLLLYCREQ